MPLEATSREDSADGDSPLNAANSAADSNDGPAAVLEQNAEARKPEPAAPSSPAGPNAKQAPEASRGHRLDILRRHPKAFLAGLILLAALVFCSYVYLNYASRFESTDDAFIAARDFSIAPRVSGYLVEVAVTDNQHIVAGDAIARIDDRPYRIALAQAEAQIANAQASIASANAQIQVQEAKIAASSAQLSEAQAAQLFAQEQAARYERLAAKGAAAVENAQQYDSELRQHNAAVQNAEATLELEKRQVATLKAQLESSTAQLAEAEAQRDRAKLNLSYTRVTAAQDGRVVQLSAAVGEFAQAGTSISLFVPDEIWVTANFKETQLDNIRPGQQATLKIDAYPERQIRGRVASIQPGSGTAFSLLPAENATGNYIKIVQRVPVKIIIDNPPKDLSLGPGMSVVPTVRINPEPSLYEWLEQLL